MKGHLEFELPMEQQEFAYASNASAYACAIERFSTYLRRFDKHGMPPGSPEIILDMIRSQWREETCDLQGLE